MNMDIRSIFELAKAHLILIEDYTAMWSPSYRLDEEGTEVYLSMSDD